MNTRFHTDLLATLGRPLDLGEQLGVAVSGGPDSLALLLLAQAAFSGQVVAVTVDHGLRPEAAGEAAMVAGVAASLGLHHAILRPGPAEPPRPGATSIQQWARQLRYRLIEDWARGRGIGLLLTAHHLDDQAETFLMRANRGAGVAGLSAIRPSRGWATAEDGETGHWLRPLLGWRRTELVALVRQAGLTPVDDPANRDDRHDRTHVRRLLAATPALSPPRLARAAANLAEAEAALDWMVERLWTDRATVEASEERGVRVVLDPADLPRELRRRLLLRGFDGLGVALPRLDKLDRLLALLDAGRRATLAGVMVTPGVRWRMEAAPPRNHA